MRDIGYSKPHIIKYPSWTGVWYWACARRGIVGVGFGDTPKTAYDDWKNWRRT